MERLVEYRQTVKTLLKRYSLHKYGNKTIQNIPIADDENKQYSVTSVGWEGNKYLHSYLFHIGLVNHKIWIYQDWTAEGVANELEEMGVPKSDIVLGWLSPIMREYGEYAVE